MAAARFELAVHTARLFVACAGFVVAARLGAVPALVAAVGLYLAAFAFNHDVAHGALRLPRWLNEALLTVLCLVMATSGRGMRRLHLRHHARPLAGDDVEGLGATVGFFRALAVSPMNAAVYRVEGVRAAGRAALIENGVAFGLTVAALLSRTVLGAAWVVANVALTLTMAAWASHLPHRPPAWLRRFALKLAWTKSAAVLSFAFHDEHHARPKVPCGALR